MNLTEKDFAATLKLFFSTLFARSMTKVIVGCPGLANNVFLFTNIKLEEIEFYEPNAAYFLHEVEIKDADFLEDLFEQFELFKKATFILYTDKFLATYAKHVGPISEIKMALHDKDISLSVNTKNNTPLVVNCGELISEYTASQYKRVFDEAKIDQLTAKEFDIRDLIDLDNPFSVIDVPFFNDRCCRAALLANQCGVSIKEYPAKSKYQEFQYSAVTTNDGTTVKLNTKFNCPNVSVVSVQPHMIWFTKAKQDKESENAERIQTNDSSSSDRSNK